MNIPPNIDLFNRYALAIFQKLYLSFPMVCNLNFEELNGEINFNKTEFNDELVRTMGYEVVIFLESEGFIKYKGFAAANTECMHARLTMKGLAILGSIPQSVQKEHDPKTLFSMIHEVFKTGLKDASAEQIQKIVGKLFSLLFIA